MGDIAVFKYPNPLAFNMEQRENFELINAGFKSCDIVSALTQVKMEEFIVEKAEWSGFVDELIEIEEHPTDKRRLRLWKRTMDYDGCGLDLFPDYDAKSTEFNFKVRVFKKSTDTVKFMEGVVRTSMRIHHEEVNVGFFKHIGQFFCHTLGSSKTSQQERDDFERKLHAALSDSTMLNAWIGENFVQFLNGAGITVQPVDPSILEADEAKIKMLKDS